MEGPTHGTGSTPLVPEGQPGGPGGGLPFTHKMKNTSRPPSALGRHGSCYVCGYVFSCSTFWLLCYERTRVNLGFSARGCRFSRVKVRYRRSYSGEEGCSNTSFSPTTNSALLFFLCMEAVPKRSKCFPQILLLPLAVPENIKCSICAGLF